MDSVLTVFSTGDHTQQTEALSKLLESAQSGNLVLDYKRLFQILAQLIYGKESTHAEVSLQILQNLTPAIGTEIEANLKTLLPSIITRLTELRPDIHKLACNVILLFATHTKNIQMIIDNMINQGFNSSEWRLRQQTIKLIPQIFECGPEIIEDAFFIKKLIENLLIMVKDESALVSIAAKNSVAAILIKSENPDSIVGKLSQNLQKVYKDDCERRVLPSQRFQSFSARLKGNLESYMKSPDGLFFGFIPSDTMEKLVGNNWRNKQSAVSEVENLVIRMNIGFEKILQYMSNFGRFLKEMLEESNYRIVLSLLSILTELAGFPTMQNYANMVQFIDPWIEKLGENKIAIRQAAYRVFKRLLTEIKPDTLLPYFLTALGHRNWHIREEALMVFITAMLMANENIDFDFMKLIEPVARCLDDEKSKVQYVASETLAVIAHRMGQEEVTSKLQPILDGTAFSNLQNRFNRRQLPILTADYIELPKSFSMSAPMQNPVMMSPQSIPESDQMEIQVNSKALMKFTKNTQSEKVFANTKQDFTESSSPSSGVPSRDFIAEKLSLLKTRSMRTLEPILSLAPPMFPINMDTKSAGSNSKVSFGHGFNKKRQVQHRMLKQKLYREGSNLSISQSTPRLDTKSDISSKSVDDAKFLGASKSQGKMKKGLDFRNTEQIVYLSEDELTPVEKPDHEILALLNALKDKDWHIQFDAINMLRRIAKFHQEVFASPITFHTIILDVVRLTESLRSGLSKNSLILIGEMSGRLPKQTDYELFSLLPSVMKKCIDTNLFLSEEAENTLGKLVIHCSESKVVSSLIHYSNINKKSAIANTKISNAFGKIIDKLGGQIWKIKDVRHFILALSNFSSNASSEVRLSARKALKLLGSFTEKQNLEMLLKRIISETHVKKIMPIIYSGDEVKPPVDEVVVEKVPRPAQTARTTLPDLKVPPLRQLPATPQKSESPPPPPSLTLSPGKVSEKVLEVETPVKKKNEPPPKELEEINENYFLLDAKEWKIRYDAIHSTSALAVKMQDQIIKHGRVAKIIDSFSKGLTDPNMKVNIHSLSALLKIIPIFGTKVETHLHLLISSLTFNMGSANSSIRTMAKDVLDAAITNCEPASALQPLIAATISSNYRAKSTLISIIGTLIPHVYKTKPQLIQKNCLLLVQRLLDDGKLEVRTACYKLIHTLYDNMGSLLIEYMPSKKLQQVMDIINQRR